MLPLSRDVLAEGATPTDWHTNAPGYFRGARACNLYTPFPLSKPARERRGRPVALFPPSVARNDGRHNPPARLRFALAGRSSIGVYIPQYGWLNRCGVWPGRTLITSVDRILGYSGNNYLVVWLTAYLDQH